MPKRLRTEEWLAIVDTNRLHFTRHSLKICDNIQHRHSPNVGNELQKQMWNFNSPVHFNSYFTGGSNRNFWNSSKETHCTKKVTQHINTTHYIPDPSQEIF